MGTPIYTTGSMDSNSDSDSSVNKKMSRIMFKIKKHYMIYVQNKKSMNFDMPKTAAKNILVYETFNKENQKQKAKKCDYRYLN